VSLGVAVGLVDGAVQVAAELDGGGIADRMGEFGRRFAD
jgi:hypothetical protein